MLLSALVLTAGTALVFGIVPALRLARTSPVEALRQQGRSATTSRRLTRLRAALGAGQVALALTLLAGAAILVVSFHRLQQVDLGFRATGSYHPWATHIAAGRWQAGRSTGAVSQCSSGSSVEICSPRWTFPLLAGRTFGAQDE